MLCKTQIILSAIVPRYDKFNGKGLQKWKPEIFVLLIIEIFLQNIIAIKKT